MLPTLSDELTQAASGSGDEIALIVSSAAVPMMIVNYTPIIRRYAGYSEAEVRVALADDAELLACLALPINLASSPEWLALYGSPLSDDAPDLPARQFTPERYPALAQSMREQLVAPFSGATSIVTEHLAPGVTGDVVVRSHWKAACGGGGLAPYSRIVIVDLDLTELRETQRSLETAVEAKDRIAATMAHELRNPMTSLVGFSSILDADWDDLDDEARREMATHTATQAKEIADLLEDLLAAAAGSAIPVAEDALEFDQVLSALDLEGISVQVPEGTIVRGDTMRIRQIIRNLVENARRYGGDRRVLRVVAGDGDIRVRVRDDGEGLPDDLVEHLFQPLAHGGASGSLGLGLSVSRELARAMGGELSFDRCEGWTQFELVLPAPGID